MLTVRGREGRVKVGYQTAARLGPFTLTPVSRGAWQVEASVMSTDAYWWSQTPRLLELSVGAQRWRWPADALVMDGRIVRGTVTGRPERR